jgi:hypothetical protein
VLCFSCASYPKKKEFAEIDSTTGTFANPYFSDSDKDYVYKANIEAFGNSFGGIFIVKKLGHKHHRIAFTTELGTKIFDFSFKDDDFKINHILKELDKKILINILKTDFRVLVKEDSTIEKAFSSKESMLYQTDIDRKLYFFFMQQGQLHKIIKVKNGKGAVEFLFSEINDDIAKNIQIIHQNLRLSIHLKSI